MPKTIRVLIQLHWGYSVKNPMFSAAQPAFRYPPPTTLIGALAYAIASRREGVELIKEGNTIYSYTAKTISYVPWTAFRFPDMDPALIVETRDLTRVLIAPYVRSDNVRPGSPYVWAVQTHGKVYTATTIEVVYVVKDGAADEIARYAWGIVRVGTKESLASVRKVDILDARVEEAKEVDTIYSFPRSLAKSIEGSYVETRMPTIDREWYRLVAVRDPSSFFEDFIIPKARVKVTPSEKACILRMEDGEALIAPKEVVAHG